MGELIAAVALAYLLGYATGWWDRSTGVLRKRRQDRQ